MKDCPRCSSPVDGLVCPTCGHREGTAPKQRRSYSAERHGPLPAGLRQRIAEALQPPKDPKAWARQILADRTGIAYPLVSYEFAREALGIEQNGPREPGEDDQ